MVDRIARFALIAMLLFLGVTTAVGAVAESYRCCRLNGSLARRSPITWCRR